MDIQRVLPLLRGIETISSCRDRNLLPVAMVGALDTLLGSGARVGIFVRVRDPLHGTTLHFCTGNESIVPDSWWTDLACQVQPNGPVVTNGAKGGHYAAMALESSALSGGQMVLVLNTGCALDEPLIIAIGHLARIFGNQMRLIDYGELDSLTGLLNRKTFDETFDRLLVASASSGYDFLHRERRLYEEEYPAWLGVIDIDHFKRINDSFGHLFGDEVLLRMGDLLRKSLRDGDRLFRFGGEEFVVILNAPDMAQAEAGFERFRVSVENHEFPQVGTVTCSIGFTAVSVKDVPTSAVGRADEAMYCAKNLGRNRVCCYERLLEDGLIVPSDTEANHNAASFDIDALFG